MGKPGRSGRLLVFILIEISKDRFENSKKKLFCFHMNSYFDKRGATPYPTALIGVFYTKSQIVFHSTHTHLLIWIWSSTISTFCWGTGFAAGAAKWASTMESEEDMGADGVPMVRLGDASVSAPFTSRSPSIQCVIDIVRQGRCTLLSALQQQQIMMLECIISAYTLSALSLQGSRSSEIQLMSTGKVYSPSISYET